MTKTAILLLAHGTPEKLDDIPAYLNHITGGRAASPEVIEELRRRYAAIGYSPLTEITLRQAEALERKLGLPVYAGMRNWHPFIAETVARMIADGVTDAVVICLAPQASRTSVGLYRRAVMTAAGNKLAIQFVESWHDHPGLVAAFAAKLRQAQQNIGDAPIIFTAHSVPCRTILSSASGAGDPYGRQVRETGALVAQAAGVRDSDWFFAFQSQGMSGGPWTGPTVEETILGLRSAGHRSVLVQPVGFVCDHVEVLYDIDIAFWTFAEDRGMHLFRAESLNDSPEFIAALADLAGARFTQAART